MVERLGSEKRMLTEDNYNVFGRRLGRKGTGYHFAVKASLLEMQTTLAFRAAICLFTSRNSQRFLDFYDT